MKPNCETSRFAFREREAFNRGYRVSDDGIITSPSGKQLKVYWCGRTYPYISVGRRAGTRTSNKVRVHRLKAYQTWGEEIYKPDFDVRHLDGNPLNFKASNLALGTRSQNQMDKPTAVRLRCAINATRMAQKHDHAAIVAAHLAGNSYAKLMAQFGIKSKGAISFIIRKSLAANRDVKRVRILAEDVYAVLPHPETIPVKEAA